MSETLDTLPSENIEEIKKRKRKSCGKCGQSAHYKHTFLLPNTRSNPASSGYGKDDVSWCSDEDVFACREHRDALQKLDGYSWCATFPAIERFEHMFLYWTSCPTDEKK